ncbi:MAG TPA: hypothetical protein VIJ95_07575 [Hanamia sp.]
MALSESLGVPGFKQLLNTVISESGYSKKEIEIVKKIMKAKQQRYAEYNNFIEKYELKEGKNGEMNVVVTNKAVLDLMSDEGIDETDDVQVEPGLVNRSAISLKYKPAFVEWLNRNNDSFTGLFELEDSTIYLIEENDSHKEVSQWLKKNFERIMINELEDITFDEKKWPPRTYKVFCDLFEIRFHDMVMDTEYEPVNKIG